MQSKEYFESVRKISKLILTSPQKMIREIDLQNLAKGFNFDEIIADVYNNLKNLGFEFIKSKFLDQNYYILITEGKDDNISPIQYGLLALIIAISKELDENLKTSDLQELFEEVWNTDLKFLIDNDYLREMKEMGIIKVTPLGKALLKDVSPDLKLRNLLEIFKHKE
ncbi:MAG: hypothetical protein ACFFKA_01370 [Candidatus Thorarchaeota archaeon]